jgi:hypothetical protein
MTEFYWCGEEGRNTPLTTSQELQRRDTIILRAFGHEEGTITIGAIGEESVTIYFESVSENPYSSENPRITLGNWKVTIEYGEEHFISTPSVSGGRSWGLVFTR